jgi:D-arginine dehydrogenase
VPGPLPRRVDVVVVGGGIAGLAATYSLSVAGRAVLVVEREAQLAQHTTGRSAAMYLEHYGGAANQHLTVASRAFLESPPDGLCDHPVLSPRAFLTFAAPGHEHLLDAELAEVGVLAEVETVDARTVLELAPYLRPGAVGAGLLEPGAQDIDVMGLHQGFVRGARAKGAVIARSAAAVVIEPGRDARWSVTTGAGVVAADVVVDAAGAWGDEVAAMAGVEPLGLAPLRRTAFTVTVPPVPPEGPMVNTAGPGFYAKPESGGLMLCSPVDETPSEPCDARAEEIDVARALDALDAATTLGARHVTRAWAGLRTFAPDRDPVIGWDDRVEGFCWMVGQGGTGIQTAPAAGALVAAVVAGDPDAGSLGPTRLRQPSTSTAPGTPGDRRNRHG